MLTKLKVRFLINFYIVYELDNNKNKWLLLDIT